MNSCKHCNKAFTCGCQKAVALDGTTVCKTCLTAYNQQVNIQKTKPVAPVIPAQPKASIAPSGVTASYVGPGRQVNLGDL